MGSVVRKRAITPWIGVAVDAQTRQVIKQRVARLVRETLSCSKKLAHHIGAMKSFIG
jgi:hypothetical protein